LIQCLKMVSKTYPVRSTVDSTVVLPKDWASSPCINRSTIESCTFESLTAATVIHRSTLDNVTLRETPANTKTAAKSSDARERQYSNAGCSVKLSNVTNSMLTKTNLRRCTVQESNFDTVSQAKRCKSQISSLTNVQSLRRCDVVDTVIENVQSMERSTARKASLIDCYKITRSTVQESNVKSSIVCRSTLTGCKVNDCAILRTEFAGMHLENGIWKRGVLVGRIDQNKDVICTKIVCLIPRQN